MLLRFLSRRISRRAVPLLVLAAMLIIAANVAAQQTAICLNNIQCTYSGTAEQTSFLARINAFRAQFGVAALQGNDNLRIGSQMLSAYLASTTEAMAHFTPNNPYGQGPGDRATAAGYTAGGVGENLTTATTPDSAFESWRTSIGHCTNMLKASYTFIGFSTVKSANRGFSTTLLAGDSGVATPREAVAACCAASAPMNSVADYEREKRAKPEYENYARTCYGVSGLSGYTMPQDLRNLLAPGMPPTTVSGSIRPEAIAFVTALNTFLASRGQRPFSLNNNAQNFAENSIESGQITNLGSARSIMQSGLRFTMGSGFDLSAYNPANPNSYFNSWGSIIDRAAGQVGFVGFINNQVMIGWASPDTTSFFPAEVTPAAVPQAAVPTTGGTVVSTKAITGTSGEFVRIDAFDGLANFVLTTTPGFSAQMSIYSYAQQSYFFYDQTTGKFVSDFNSAGQQQTLAFDPAMRLAFYVKPTSGTGTFTITRYPVAGSTTTAQQPATSGGNTTAAQQPATTGSNTTTVQQPATSGNTTTVQQPTTGGTVVSTKAITGTSGEFVNIDAFDGLANFVLTTTPGFSAQMSIYSYAQRGYFFYDQTTGKFVSDFNSAGQQQTLAFDPAMRLAFYVKPTSGTGTFTITRYPVAGSTTTAQQPATSGGNTTAAQQPATGNSTNTTTAQQPAGTLFQAVTFPAERTGYYKFIPLTNETGTITFNVTSTGFTGAYLQLYNNSTGERLFATNGQITTPNLTAGHQWQLIVLSPEGAAGTATVNRSGGNSTTTTTDQQPATGSSTTTEQTTTIDTSNTEETTSEAAEAIAVDEMPDTEEFVNEFFSVVNSNRQAAGIAPVAYHQLVFDVLLSVTNGHSDVNWGDAQITDYMPLEPLFTDELVSGQTIYDMLVDGMEVESIILDPAYDYMAIYVTRIQGAFVYSILFVDGVLPQETEAPAAEVTTEPTAEATSDVPVEEPTELLEEAGTAEFPFDARMTQDDQLYEQPDTGSSIVSNMNANENITVLSMSADGGWYEILDSVGNYGWVQAYLVIR